MSDVQVTEGRVFGSGGGRDLKCDVYTPPGLSAPAPGLLLVHGGGWRMGERAMMRDYGVRFAAAGFVCIAPEYRLTPESPWPAQIEDVKAAIRWTRAHNGELQIDDARIAALGSSAGAHLVLLAAGTPGLAGYAGSGGSETSDDTLAAVIAIFPPTVFHVGEQRTRGASPAKALMGDAEEAEAARLASPLTHVRPEFPPTLLLHGSADKVVPPSASIVMYEALVAAGVPVELHMYAEQPHGFARQPEFVDQVSAESAHFLRRYLDKAAVRETAEAAAR
ncbi:MAG: alpha/beta hydrolase fold domain-containing protein [Dehalococcoidia bacterium]